MHNILPGVLEKDWIKIEEKLNLIKSFTNSAHIDFIDGKFAPNITCLDSELFKNFTNDFLLEAHLMVENPLQYLEPLASAGFKRFLGHIEKMENLEEFIAKGETLGEVGLAIDLKTDLEKLAIPFQDLDCLLLMSVDAGFSGQELSEKIIERIKKIRLQNETIAIEIDGGINIKNIQSLQDAGANRFVATSFIFTNQDPPKAYNELVNLVF